MPATNLDTRIRAYLEKLPEAISGSGGHVATLKAANALVIGFGLSIDEAQPYLDAYNQRCQPPWLTRELNHKLSEAVANKCGLTFGWLLDESLPESAPKPVPAYSPPPAQLTREEKKNRSEQAVINKLGGWRADPVELWEASPVRLLKDFEDDARLVIYWLSESQDLVNVNFDYRLKPDGRVDIVGPGLTLTASEWNEYLSLYPMPCGAAGCWWRANPVLAREGSGRDGSFTDADVARFRYHLFEIDSLPLDLQLSFFSRIRVPIAMISDSGGKSLHALVKSFARTLAEYQAEASYLLDELFATYGVDTKNKNPSRYSRLPGGARKIGARALAPGETEARQKILYLNPQPSGALIL
jgi:hypothetical protein